ncbi:peptidylprolyl isomerase [Bacteroidales bacterium OttesenSCG-928-K22]|nr:peptidylprolyl isomerase [Bacteroidales bacterium OttesenSCG-928-K22]
MKFRNLILSFVISFFIYNLSAQTIVTIGDEQISTKDFLTLYEKNNNPETTIEVLTKEEYLELYINFKLKVKEAETLGLNKESKFINEYNKYRDQLAKPYLMDSITYSNIIKESYEHMKYDIRASHILIDLPEAEVSSDTIFAWNEAMRIRNLFLKGENFNDLAYKFSNDPSAREREWEGRTYAANKGDLGYFTAFDMIYPFEQAAYSLDIGQVSMPIRSKFGYHLIYLEDKVPALLECEVSHLLLVLPSNATSADSAKIINKASKIYERMMKGENFEKLVEEFSDDKTTSKNGGKLMAFTTNKIEANFIKNITTLENGEISKPFFTPYGCHIVRMEKRGELKSLEEESENIKRRIANSDRSNFQNSFVYTKLCKKYNYKLNGENYKEIIPLIEKNFKNLSVINLTENKELFTYTNNSTTQEEFIKYIFLCENTRPTHFSEANIIKYLNDFVYETLVNAEIEFISKENTEFRLLLQEYYDGILLFNINEELIWQKAINDSLGLVNFYESNKENYQWKDRVRGNFYIISDPSIAKDVRKALKKGIDGDELTKMFVNSLHIRQVTIEKRYFEPGDNIYVDQTPKKLGISKIFYDKNKAYFVKINELLPSRIKTFEESKGLVISDYQQYLEQEWIKALKAKYPVVVNYSELEKIN